MCAMVDKFVIARKKFFEEQGDKEKNPTCFIDLLLQSEVYAGDV